MKINRYVIIEVDKKSNILGTYNFSIIWQDFSFTKFEMYFSRSLVEQELGVVPCLGLR